MTIRFASVVGSDTGLLDAAIAHYRGLGVDSFHIIRHIESFDDPEFQRAQDVLTRHGLAFAAVHQGPWDEDLNAYLIQAQMRRHPSDWWVVADLDEFHVYDRPLTDIITACKAGGYDYVMGALLDRVAADGTLPALNPTTSIWAQYALAGLVTLRVVRAVTSKVTLARGDVHLHLGQHGALTGRSLPATEAFAQVHHFKWTDSVLPRDNDSLCHSTPPVFSRPDNNHTTAVCARGDNDTAGGASDDGGIRLEHRRRKKAGSACDALPNVRRCQGNCLDSHHRTRSEQGQ